MKRVIIIGGGFAGATCAKALQKDFNVTLIDPKEYFEYTPGILRAAVHPQVCERLRVYHRSYLKKATVLKDRVHSISESEVSVDGKKLPFDYLIITTGNSYNNHLGSMKLPGPINGDAMAESFQQVQKSRKILILGGGLVGVELAAELVDLGGKEITIAHNAERLMNRQAPKASGYAEEFFKKRGVKLMFNQIIEHTEGKKVFTADGTVLETDLTFMCFGFRVNGEFLRKNFPESLNPRGQIKVNKHLQLVGQSHLFAGGDVNSIQEEKTAQNATWQAKIIVKNIKNMEKKRPLIRYQSRPRLMVISLGKHTGVLTYRGFTFTGWIPGILKELIVWITMWKMRV